MQDWLGHATCKSKFGDQHSEQAMGIEEAESCGRSIRLQDGVEFFTNPCASSLRVIMRHHG